MQNKSLFVVLTALGFVGVSSAFFGCKNTQGSSGAGGDNTDISSANGAKIWHSTPSQNCLECHEDVYQQWVASDHANANRLFVESDWDEAFGRTHYFTLNGEVSEMKRKDGKSVIHTLGSDGKFHDFHPEMVLAYNPMVQFMVPTKNGRWQTTELAWDVHQKDWFNVYGEQHRRSDEWGHWSQRGMNWNAQCAVCHTSFYSKNYNPLNDSYQSKWKEMGINCQQCHGEMPNHIANPEAPIDLTEKVTHDDYFESCYSCHSRREDITGNFRIGDKFADHHRLQLPNSDRYYFADGQIKDEVFVYGSFLMSKMHHQGVRCLDCHDPHTLKPKLAFENNALCMRCHTDPGVDGATPIDPVAHGHHQPGSEGNRCVECHMPERTYMERDPRRDHGFHTPDPVLAEELGVPNACMNCHDKEGEGEEWTKEWFVKWYGESENLKKKRHHAQVVAKAYRRDVSSKPEMLELLKTETSPMWKGAFAQMILEMQPTMDELKQLLPLLNDESPLVRNAMVQSLSNYPGMEGYIRQALQDESRLVRLDAAWYLRGELESGSSLEKELNHYMDYTSDQPGGALRKAHYYADLGDKENTILWINKVVEWDATSSDAWINRGLMLNRFGETQAALESFEKSFNINPNSVLPLTYSAMLIGESGDLAATQAAWKRVVKVDPNYGRGWYNLGLLYNQMGDTASAIGYLDQGQAVAPEDMDIPYAKATILMRNGNAPEAIKLISEILEKEPDYQPALQMMQMMRQSSPLQ